MADLFPKKDQQHPECVTAFANLGYDILCEKPLATSAAECREMADAVQKANIIFGIGHVLRYSPYNMEIKRVLDSGALGRVMNVVHVEPIGNVHFSHSYVRGNWHKEKDTSFSLLTKSCQLVSFLFCLFCNYMLTIYLSDLDIIAFVATMRMLTSTAS
jgi:predicted dehydrogenase